MAASVPGAQSTSMLRRQLRTAAPPCAMRLPRPMLQLAAVATVLSIVVLGGGAGAAAAAGDPDGWRTDPITTAAPDTDLEKNFTIPFTPVTTVPPQAPPKVATAMRSILLATFTTMTIVILYQVYQVFRLGYAKLGYFNLCLTFALMWSILRVIVAALFLAHHHVHHELPAAIYEILFVLPPCLQFAAFTLLVLYFGSVVISSWRIQRRVRGLFFIKAGWLGLNLAYLIINVVSASILRHRKHVDSSTPLLQARVIVSETLTFLSVLLLAAFVLRIRKLIATQAIIEGEGTSARQVSVLTCLLIPLLTSRFVYNMTSLGVRQLGPFGFNVAFLSNHTHIQSESSWGFVVFLIALIVWEICPIALIVWFFRAKRQASNYSQLNSGSVYPQTLFFEKTPYLSDDEEEEEEEEPRINTGLSPGRINTYGGMGYSSNLVSSPSSYDSSYMYASTPHSGGIGSY